MIGAMADAEAAFTAFTAAHREDPEGEAMLYHERVLHFVDQLDPEAPLEVRLAAACQHIRRWSSPRSDYPDGRTGYKQWRSALARFHAEQAGEILRHSGFGVDVVGRVGDLLTKKRLRSDPHVQLLEDAVCLTFIELQLDAFALKHPKAKVVDILRRTWDKMSVRGHEAARSLVGELANAGTLRGDVVATVAEAIR